MSVIDAKGVSIRYITGDLKNIGLKEYVMRRIRGEYHVAEFWADKDITFKLEKGDMLGIIGANGAGKSTLLKAIAGIMVPTKGSMHVEGNVAALLELASGFDGDMTVKENAYLRGAMLGYTREYMDAQYKQIIEFSELEGFEDRLFKQLSSGMKSRLAFAIACLVNPDIIILDEVLSVGDGAFQKKSAARMREILNSGVTGILVSHSVGQVRELCNKILWLDHGKQVGFSDKVKLYCDAYEEFLNGATLPQNEQEILELGMLPQNRAKERARKKETEERKRKEMEQKHEEELARKQEEESKRLKEEQDKRILEDNKRKEEKEQLLKEKEFLVRENAKLLNDNNLLNKEKDILILENENISKQQELLQKEIVEVIGEKEQIEKKNISLLAQLDEINDKQMDFSDGDFTETFVSKYLQYSHCARIDIKNVGNDGNTLEFSDISDPNIRKTSPAWFCKEGIGYVLLTNLEKLTFSVKVHCNGVLRVILRGMDVGIDGKRIPVWIEYSSFFVNGKTIFNVPKLICHDKSYYYEMDIKDGDIVVIETWQKYRKYY